jgi:hypothetical protein
LKCIRQAEMVRGHVLGLIGCFRSK